MPTTTATTARASAKEVAIDILRTAGEPLPAKEIAKRVLASGRCAGLKGKTPEATISAMLAVGSKPGGPFTRVGKGTYTLTDAPAATSPKTSKRTAPKRAPVRKAAAASKTKAKPRSRSTAKRTR